MDTSLTTATRSLKATLTQAAVSGELGRAAGDALGLLAVPESFWQLQQAWAEGQFSDFPAISLSTGGSMAEARGAYVAETNSILVNQEWLAKASEAEVLAVLVEEVGHSLDTRFNSVDTPGDEGELFSRLLLSQVPSASERARIASDNDAIQVILANGQQAWAEAADALDPIVRLTGSSQADQLSGGSNNDALFGLAGIDELIGGAGNDYLDGGQGADIMTGGLGDDIYTVDSGSDLVVEAADEGKDSILSTISLALPDNVENLDLRTNGEATGTGNDLNNVIYGGFGTSRLIGGAGNDSLYGRGTNDDHLEGGLGNDYLDGGQGIDLMEGGLGDDAYVVRDSADQIIENAQEGNDWVYATTSYTLSDNIENLQLYGTGDGLNLKARGNGLNNTLIGDQWANGLSGGAGNDYLNGGSGADSMDGGTGNDTYIVDNEGDSIVELSGEGTDWVISTVSQTLASNVDHLDLRGTANLVGTGNGDDNIIKGNAGNSTLHGGAGNDSLYGRGSGSDTLFGDVGNDYLDGGAGADSMDGGSGNDTYVVDNADDQVIEAENSGSDWVISNISYTLGDNLEGLMLRGGASDLNGSGNDLNNTIEGNAGRNTLNGGGGNDILNGGAGSDTMVGGAGSDLFVINNKEANGSIAMDTIGDFQTGSDVLYLSRTALNIDASRLGSGVLKATDFKLVTSATEGGLDGANGLASTAAFVFDQTSGILYHNSNGAELGAGDSNPGGIMDMSGAMLKASDIQLI